jgi:hypothetical protein
VAAALGNAYQDLPMPLVNRSLLQELIEDRERVAADMTSYDWNHAVSLS